MDRRKKRTSTNQYMMYIDLMEKDSIFATGRVPRDVDSNYLQKKWKELSDKLNTCTGGPKLTSEEWRKRLNDWKNTTRCKYRRSISGEKDITLTPLELKALDLFGKTASCTGDVLNVQLKCEKDEDDEDPIDTQRTSESLQKELQAAVEEAIGGDDEEIEEIPEDEEVLNETENITNDGTTYRTIVVDNSHAQYDNNNELEFITHRRQVGTASTSTNTSATGVQTVMTATSNAVTKLINGDIPLKRLRNQAPDQIIYEVKKTPMVQSHSTPRNITIHSATSLNPGAQIHQQPQTHIITEGVNNYQQPMLPSSSSAMTSQDAREIARQLKRIADVKSEKLRFEIARFKFNNPGFNFNSQAS